MNPHALIRYVRQGTQSPGHQGMTTNHEKGRRIGMALAI
jgi:hypothetical protein